MSISNKNNYKDYHQYFYYLTLLLFAVLCFVISKYYKGIITWADFISELSFNVGISLFGFFILTFFITRKQEQIQLRIMKETYEKYFIDPISDIYFSSDDLSKLYTVGSTLIGPKIKKRLLIYQLTPSLLLGARPYDANEISKHAKEKEYYNELVKFIEINMKKDSKLECIYLYNNAKTNKEIGENIILKDTFYNNYQKYRKINDNFKIKGITMDVFEEPENIGKMATQCSLIIADDCVNYGIKTEGGGINVEINSRSLADNLCTMMNEIYNSDKTPPPKKRKN